MGFSTDKLKVESGDGHNFTLLEAFTYTAKNGEVITVPIGATSDGFSTPRIMWREIPPFGQGWKAAYLHDYLYRYSKFPKERCDALLLEALECLGVNSIEAKIIYEGVVLGGKSSFNEDRKAQP